MQRARRPAHPCPLRLAADGGSGGAAPEPLNRRHLLKKVGWGGRLTLGSAQRAPALPVTFGLGADGGGAGAGGSPLALQVTTPRNPWAGVRGRSSLPAPAVPPLLGHLISLPAAASARLLEEAPGVTEGPCAPSKQSRPQRKWGRGEERPGDLFLHVNTGAGLLERLFPSFLFLESLMLPRPKASCWTRRLPSGAREEK